MSESTFPFGVVDETGQDDQATGSGRRLPLLLGGVAAVVLGGAAYLLLGLGGTDDEADLARSGAPAVPVAAPAVPGPAVTPQPGKLPVPTAVRIGRNPFKALYVAPAVAAAPADGTGSTGSDGVPTDVGTGTGTGAGAGEPLVPTGPGVPLPGAPLPEVPLQPLPEAPSQPQPLPTAPVDPGPVVEEHVLVLVRVTGEGSTLKAHFTVDGKPMHAAVGATFGPTMELKLLSLQQGPRDDQWTAVLQVGDGDPFDVITGQRTFVR